MGGRPLRIIYIGDFCTTKTSGFCHNFCGFCDHWFMTVTAMKSKPEHFLASHRTFSPFSKCNAKGTVSSIGNAFKTWCEFVDRKSPLWIGLNLFIQSSWWLSNFCRNNFWRFFEKVSSASPLVKNFNFEVKSKFGAKVLKFEMEEKN